MTFFCDFFLEGKKKQPKKPQNQPQHRELQGLKIRCLIKNKKAIINHHNKTICFISSPRKLSEGIGNPALTINPRIYFNNRLQRQPKHKGRGELLLLPLPGPGCTAHTLPCQAVNSAISAEEQSQGEPKGSAGPQRGSVGAQWKLACPCFPLKSRASSWPLAFMSERKYISTKRNWPI